MSSYYSYILTEARSEFILGNKDNIKKIWNILSKDLELPLNSTEEQKKQDVEKFLKELEQNKFISKYLNWVVKQYIKTDWRFPEDVEKLEKNLNKFYRSLAYLKNNGLETDINKYDMSSFNQLMLDLPETNRQEDINIKNNEIEVIYEDSSWILLTPKTERAAIKYGKGTEWCTAATEGRNYFNIYNERGPLYILINKKNPEDKYQFHLESGSFMDVTDIEVYPEEMNEIINYDKGLHDAIQKIVFNYYGNKDISIAIGEGELREYLDDYNIELGLDNKTIMEAAFDESISEIEDWNVEAEDIFSLTGTEILNFIANEYDVPCLKDKESFWKIHSFLFDYAERHSVITPLNNLRKAIILALNETETADIYCSKKIDALAEDMKDYSQEVLKEFLNAKKIDFYYDSVEIIPNNYDSLSEHLTELILGEDKLAFGYLHGLNDDNLHFEYYYDAEPKDWDDWIEDSLLPILKNILNLHPEIIKELKEYNPHEVYNGVEETTYYDPWDTNYDPFGDKAKEE